MVKLSSPELIIIMLYRPPSCSDIVFTDVMDKLSDCMFSLPCPLPNIIFLGDFNLPNMDWNSSVPNCCFANTLCQFVDSFFLQQLVTVPTRKNNILDLIFSNCELIKNIDVSNTFISDHCLLSVSTFIPTIALHEPPVLNSASSIFEKLNFRRCEWDALRSALMAIDWASLFGDLSTIICFNEFVDTVAKTCSLIVPLSKPPRTCFSKFVRERKLLMKKRTKLEKDV